MTWEINETLNRDEAIRKINEQAVSEGIGGSFKVYYNGNLIATPNDLPEQVDMRGIRVSAVLNNATRA